MTDHVQNDTRKIAVLDTSVLLHDSGSIFGFNGYDIIIPLIVLDEVDKFRSLDNEIGRNARSFIRSVVELKGEGGSLNKGVVRKQSGEKLIIKVVDDRTVAGLRPPFNPDKNDDKILASTLEISAENRGAKVMLVTKDISLMAKANVLGILCEDYNADVEVTDASQLYSGTCELVVGSSIIDCLYSTGYVSSEDLEPYLGEKKSVFYPNMGVTLVDEIASSHTALCVYNNGKLNKLRYSTGKAVCNVTAKNREQVLAMELLLDDSVKLVTLTGCAGTGKTLCALACGISKTADNNVYDRLVVSRPIQPMGKDIGYLPGDVLEKILPWVSPIKDSIEFIFGGDRSKFNEMLTYGMLEIEVLTYIRGRSLARTMFIIDEAQSLTQHEMKTIISRIGKDSKIVLTGDIYQIDNPYLDTVSNGLTCVVEKFKHSHLAGHVNLVKGQRSELASLAAKVL